VTLIVPKHLCALSNMPIVMQSTQPSNKRSPFSLSIYFRYMLCVFFVHCDPIYVVYVASSMLYTCRLWLPQLWNCLYVSALCLCMPVCVCVYVVFEPAMCILLCVCSIHVHVVLHIHTKSYTNTHTHIQMVCNIEYISMHHLL